MSAYRVYRGESRDFNKADKNRYMFEVKPPEPTVEDGIWKLVSAAEAEAEEARAVLRAYHERDRLRSELAKVERVIEEALNNV